MRRLLIALPIVVALVAACHESATAPTGAVVAHGVVVTVSVPSACILGNCTVVPGGPTTLGLVVITNLGDTTTFLPGCQNSAVLNEQQLVGNQWINIAPAVTCPFTQTLITVAPGDSVRINRFFSAGERRLLLSVSTNPALDSAVLATSAAFVVLR